MIDTRLERGKQWLESLLELTGFSASVDSERSAMPESSLPDNEAVPQEGAIAQEIHSSSELSAGYWLTIDETQLTPSQIDILIGPEGSTLDAIQYLANSILNLEREREEQAAYTIELNGYRARRQEELRSLAEHAASLVRETGKEYEIKSLSAAERRQVHTFLQDSEDIETFSRGQEPDRRLVVRLR